MSIIRSNIARQLLAEGGAPRASFRNGGGRTDANTMSGSGVAFDDGFDTGEEFGRDTYAQQYEAMNVPDAVSRGGGDNEPSFFQKAKDRFKNFETDSRINRVNRGLLTTPAAIKSVVGLKDIPPQLLATLADDYTQGGLFSEGLVGGDISLSNAAETLQGLEDLGVDLTGDIRSQVGDISRSKFAERFGPKTKGGEGGDNEPIKKLKAPITEKIEEKPKLSDIENLLRFRGSAFEDGGEVRQDYFGGGITKAFKKAAGAVKKVAKSPIGKAALFAGLGAYGLGAGPFAKGSTMFGGKLAELSGSGFLKSKFMKDLLLKEGKDKFTFGNLSPFSLLSIPTVASYLFSKKEDEEEDETLPEVARSDPRFQSLINYYGGPTRFAAEGGDIDEAPMKMASKPSSFSELNMLSLDLFGRPYDQLNDSEQEILMEYFSKNKDMPERTMAAGGGIMNPNDEMLDLGGNEMDLRGGGFVPLGEYEKKDDVPARLSKNEFVFTADAVRAAGGGSVDRGADLMYKTMKQLENKVV